ncbi:hypothetical protein PHYBOEH_003700 [Phytophthora boehmeriae]|uniref:EF-hand domain-containing protein n=1 Tax=Phytophthora boehmeriae TaxID=109152 RepID=A0A8T1WUZ2_9STRA|nr:hypothetical protein PHYBOEH_003700 [Phytophthora boehmeriae]
MGIAISQPVEGTNNKDSALGVAAVAEITQFTLVQLQSLQAIWHPSGSGEGGDLVSREADLSCNEFEEALDSVQFAASDRAIFDRLFVLLDRTGDERIIAIQFLIAASLLLRGSLEVKLQGAFQFAQDAESSSDEGISPEGLRFALSTLAAMAGYFGDPYVTLDDVNQVVQDALCASESCRYDDLVKVVADHPLMQQYAYGIPETNNDA